MSLASHTALQLATEGLHRTAHVWLIGQKLKLHLIPGPKIILTASFNHYRARLLQGIVIYDIYEQ